MSKTIKAKSINESEKKLLRIRRVWTSDLDKVAVLMEEPPEKLKGSSK